jgi:hypothetical protein
MLFCRPLLLKDMHKQREERLRPRGKGGSARLIEGNAKSLRLKCDL